MKANAYYEKLKAKWASDYPSSQTIDEVWALYREFGYSDPAATFAEALGRVNWETRRVLDFGCDNGLLLDFICSAVPDLEGHGVDINETAVAAARTRFPALHFTAFGGVTLPYEDGRFDLVFTSAVLKHIRFQDRDHVYQELARVASQLLVVEKDASEQKEVLFQGWTFYESNFDEELGRRFRELHTHREAGDFWGLYQL